MVRLEIVCRALGSATRLAGLIGMATAGALVVFAATANAQEKKETQSAWVKICQDAKVSDDETKNICITHHERLDGNSGRVLVSAAVRRVEGSDEERFLVMVPLGMAIPPGIRVRVDEEKQGLKLSYTLCHPGGCTAETEATAELVDKLRKGGKLVVAAINAAGKPVGFPVPLTGFTAAYEGEPVDSKQYAQARRQLMQQIRQRQIDRAKAAEQVEQFENVGGGKNQE